MGSNQETGSYIQCSNCGHIYMIKRKIPIDIPYVDCVCPKCEHDRGLNCGSDYDDMCLYMDYTLDERYYGY